MLAKDSSSDDAIQSNQKAKLYKCNVTHSAPSYQWGYGGETDTCYNNRMLHKYKRECVYGHKSKQILKYIGKRDWRTKSIKANHVM